MDALHAQTLPPDRVIVVANNCTDLTAQVAAGHGAEVIDLPHCEGRKAGALNTALARILPDLDDTDYMFVQDADTILVPDFLRLALECARVDRHRVVCGRYAAVKSRNPLIVLQRCEFSRDGRATSRRWERTHILVGTSSLFPVHALRDVIAARASGELPGTGGYVYLPSSVTEDFELSLALKTLGYRTMSPDGAEAVTDAMHTVPDLWHQRIRWMRGGVEDLRLYGRRPVTRGFHLRRPVHRVRGRILAAVPRHADRDAGHRRDGETSLPWMILTAVFIACRVTEVRKAGPASMICAGLLIPEMAYNTFAQVVFVTAWAESFSRKPAAWVET